MEVALSDTSRIPKNIAIIMDGNGRWAAKRGAPRIEGHRAGAKSVRAVVEEACKLEIESLVLFAFSWENWARSEEEVGALMGLLIQYLDSEFPLFQENNIRLQAIGAFDRLPAQVRANLFEKIERTSTHTGLRLVLALSYGGQMEIVQAAQAFSREVESGRLNTEDLTPELFRSFLYSPDLPYPDLLIRTSGESRISNFLLWQIAYAELIFTETLWPDFGKEAFRNALEEYTKRDRRFGLERAPGGSVAIESVS